MCLRTNSRKRELIIDFIRSVSEKIGSTKSKEEYEEQRKSLKSLRDMFIKNSEDAQGDFGEDVYEMFPQLLISKAVNDAKEILLFFILKRDPKRAIM